MWMECAMGMWAIKTLLQQNKIPSSHLWVLANMGCLYNGRKTVFAVVIKQPKFVNILSFYFIWQFFPLLLTYAKHLSSVCHIHNRNICTMMVMMTKTMKYHWLGHATHTQVTTRYITVLVSLTSETTSVQRSKTIIMPILTQTDGREQWSVFKGPCCHAHLQSTDLIFISHSQFINISDIWFLNGSMASSLI